MISPQTPAKDVIAAHPLEVAAKAKRLELPALMEVPRDGHGKVGKWS